MRSDVASEKRCDSHRKVSCEFIEAHSQAARFRPDQIDFHNHSHRPGKTLIDAEECICDDYPFPTRCPHHDEWHRQSEQPSDDEHVFATPNVSEMAGNEISQCLDHTEANDERDD